MPLVRHRLFVVATVFALFLAISLVFFGNAFGDEAFYPWLVQAWLQPPELCQVSKMAHEFQLEQCNKFFAKRTEFLALALSPWISAAMIFFWLQSSVGGLYHRANRSTKRAIGTVVHGLRHSEPRGLAWRAWCLGGAIGSYSEGSRPAQWFLVPSSAPRPRPGQAVECVACGSFLGMDIRLGRLHTPQMAIVKGMR